MDGSGSMTVRRQPIEMVDGVPMGWCLSWQSWPAHCDFHRQTGRPMLFKEYSRLFRARDGERLCEIWRVTAAEGEAVIVQRCRDARYARILPPDWTPSSAPTQARPRAQPRPRQERSAPAADQAGRVVRNRKLTTPEANAGGRTSQNVGSTEPQRSTAITAPPAPRPTPRDLRAHLGLPVAVEEPG
jgi:hypothetical protein